MKDENALKLARAGSGRRQDGLRKSKLRGLAVGAALALAAAAAVYSVNHPERASQAADGGLSSAQPEPAGFDYFPDRYVNQATEVAEHIQAF